MGEDRPNFSGKKLGRTFAAEEMFPGEFVRLEMAQAILRSKASFVKSA